MTAVTEEKEAYRAGFERFASSRAAAAEPGWLRERRTAAFARFVETGFPTPRDEAWRHTPVAPLTRGRFEPADPEARPAEDVLGRLPPEGIRGVRLASSTAGSGASCRRTRPATRASSRSACATRSRRGWLVRET